MNVFIDTNILLEIYEAKSASASDLDELIKWHKNKTITLVTTQMAIEEFERNRDRVVSESLSKFKKIEVNIVFPGFVRDDPKYGDLKEAERILKENHKQLSENIAKSIRSGGLQADAVVDRYFKTANILPYNEKTVTSANYRDKIGKDPGKPGQLGDHINWILLQGYSKTDDLTIVSSDGDYECKLSDGNIRSVLQKEFNKETSKKVILAKSIKQFLDTFGHYAQTVRSTNRHEAVMELVDSGSFASTHSAIAKLSVYSDFTDSEIGLIINAYKENGQVGGICTDDDVADFYKTLRKQLHGKTKILADYETVNKSCGYDKEPEIPDWLK